MYALSAQPPPLIQPLFLPCLLLDFETGPGNVDSGERGDLKDKGCFKTEIISQRFLPFVAFSTIFSVKGKGAVNLRFAS